MSIYTLDQDEAVIMQSSRVSNESCKVDLILTNKNLIQVDKGFFGADKSYTKYPLTKLKVFNGKANVLVGKDSSGKKQLELYFNKYDVQYSFDGLLEENKWANAIIKAHKQLMEEIEKEEKAASGKGSILKSLSDTFDSAKEKILPKKVPALRKTKCPKCGAELSGEKGITVQCEYCNETIIIK